VIGRPHLQIIPICVLVRPIEENLRHDDNAVKTHLSPQASIEIGEAHKQPIDEIVCTSRQDIVDVRNMFTVIIRSYGDKVMVFGL
jgi:hypothetical protein